MKVSDLNGALLDYWVQRAQGDDARQGAPEGAFSREAECEHAVWWRSPGREWICGRCNNLPLRYSSEWERGGQIIERNNIGLTTWMESDWCAAIDLDAHTQYDGGVLDGKGFQVGATPLVAAMRAYVTSKFGDEVSGEVSA